MNFVLFACNCRLTKKSTVETCNVEYQLGCEIKSFNTLSLNLRPTSISNRMTFCATILYEIMNKP